VALAQDESIESALFIQYAVTVEESDGTLRTSGGHMRAIGPWVPADEHLKALTYRYDVPE